MALRTNNGVGIRAAFFAVFSLFLAAGAAASPDPQKDRQARDKSTYEAQYQAETNPVRKARILGKLAPIAVNVAGDEIKADQDDPALASLRHLRDEARETSQSLTATGVDADRHPAGFKELQIGLRESIRLLDNLVFALPLDDRPPFEQVRTDLSAVQSSLIDELFPPSDRRSRKARERLN